MLVIAGVGVVMIAVALWASRKIIAREALTGWLEQRGIASEAEVEAFGPTGFTGKLRIGDPANPDFTAERAEVRYGLRGFSVEVRSVRLVKPVLRASFKGGKLSAGALDPLIAEFRKRPPRPGAPKPRIEIEAGILQLATDYGPVRMGADALVDDGRLVRLAAGSTPGRLKGEGFDVAFGAGRLTATSRTNRLDAALDAPITQAEAGGLGVKAGRVRLTLNGPYPDLEKKRGEGPLTIRANVDGREVSIAGQRLGGAQLAAAFTGRTAGWIDTLSVTGEATADLRAETGAFGPAGATGLRATAQAGGVRWTRSGGDSLSARLRINGMAERVTAQDLTLTNVRAALRGPASADRDGASVSLTGAANGRGGWSGLGSVDKADSREIAALKRGVRSFAFQAPGFAISHDRGPMRLALLEPVSVRPDAGGQARLTPRDDGYRLTLAGGGLPEVDAHVSRFALEENGATAGGRATAKFSIGPVEQGVFDASGTVRIGEGGVRFTADRCVAVTAAKLELGENDVERLAGRLCPDGRPTLTLAGGGWSLGGRAQGVSAQVPFLDAAVSEAAGRATLGMQRGRLSADVAVADARVTDIAAETRFNPMKMSGRARLARDLWTADLAFRTPGGVQVATAKLEHSMAAGVGGVDVNTGELVFAEGGLQPAQLSPLAERIGSPATGSARFTGGFRWEAGGGSSGGTLTIPRLDFHSPAGRVTNLAGTVDFISLAPLVAASGQVLRADAVDAIVPLTGVQATFSLAADALRVSGGVAQVGGGTVRIESLDLPLDPKAPTKGVLLFEGVQLHDLVEASPFGDKVELDAKVSGRAPFERQGDAIRITGGTLQAIQPGRLSIAREALTTTQANTTVGPTVPPEGGDLVSDFAYQAMENLAFDTLTATIDSRDGGRLNVLFHIIGKHDPPQHQEIRLTLRDLIRRDFMKKKLPLPSGTGVDLTLDTSLNLDELLRDYGDYQRLRGSGAVQP